MSRESEQGPESGRPRGPRLGSGWLHPEQGPERKPGGPEGPLTREVWELLTGEDSPAPTAPWPGLPGEVTAALLPGTLGERLDVLAETTSPEKALSLALAEQGAYDAGWSFRWRREAGVEDYRLELLDAGGELLAEEPEIAAPCPPELALLLAAGESSLRYIQAEVAADAGAAVNPSGGALKRARAALLAEQDQLSPGDLRVMNAHAAISEALEIIEAAR